MAHWEKTEYQKIKEAKFANDKIVVDFENGDHIEVPKRVFISFNSEDIKWNEISFSPFEIFIPAHPDPIEIPWDKLRVLTDTEFGKYLASRAAEQAKLIGTKIKKLREKKGIKGSELAERADVTPQTISRIEQGHTDVGFGTLRKILASMGYTLKDLANQELAFEMENSKKSFDFLVKRLNSAGVDNNLLMRKIIPNNIQLALKNSNYDQPDLLLDEAASYVGNVYGWKLNEIWSSNNLQIKSEAFDSAYYKLPINANINQIKAYSHYAFYLAKIVLKAYSSEKKDYPGDTEEFKTNFIAKHKRISLQSLLEYVWDLGICVMPLNDSGVFHGASWNIENRHVIVLKQNTTAHARWIFDLLHELYHVFAHLEEKNTSYVETEELSPFSTNESNEELEANAFASEVLFGNRAEELAQKCVEVARGNIQNLKQAVVTVAKKENIGVDILSNYLAFKLSYQGQNWWGTAAGLQINEPNPFVVVSDFMKNKISMQKLNPMDFNLLNSAVTN